MVKLSGLRSLGFFMHCAKEPDHAKPEASHGELEHRTGTRLFDRSAAGVDATAVGEVFLDHAREVTSRAADFEREMDLLKGLEKGELRIGSGTYPSNMYVDKVVGRLLGTHPSVKISVANDNWANLMPLLRKREWDLAIINVSAAEADREMHVTRLKEHRGYLVVGAGHPLLKRIGLGQIEEAWNYPFVATSSLPIAFFKELAGAMLPTRNASKTGTKSLQSVACESLQMMKTIAMESDGVALLPLNVAYEDMLRGKLAIIPAPPGFGATFGVVRLAHRSLSPLGETFVRLVQQADAELSEWEEKTAKRLFAQRGAAKS